MKRLQEAFDTSCISGSVGFVRQSHTNRQVSRSDSLQKANHHRSPTCHWLAPGQAAKRLVNTTGSTSSAESAPSVSFLLVEIPPLTTARPRSPSAHWPLISSSFPARFRLIFRSFRGPAPFIAAIASRFGAFYRRPSAPPLTSTHGSTDTWSHYRWSYYRSVCHAEETWNSFSRNSFHKARLQRRQCVSRVRTARISDTSDTFRCLVKKGPMFS